MRTCRRCEGLFTGRSPDGLCLACEDRNRHRVYADPETAEALTRLQRARLDSLHDLLNAMRKPGAVAGPPSSGHCIMCGRAIDDHSLTYSPSQYPIALCNVQPAYPEF